MPCIYLQDNGEGRAATIKRKDEASVLETPPENSQHLIKQFGGEPGNDAADEMGRDTRSVICRLKKNAPEACMSCGDRKEFTLL